MPGDKHHRLSSFNSRLSAETKAGPAQPEGILVLPLAGALGQLRPCHPVPRGPRSRRRAALSPSPRLWDRLAWSWACPPGGHGGYSPQGHFGGPSGRGKRAWRGTLCLGSSLLGQLSASAPLGPWAFHRCGSECECEFRSACECTCGCRCGCGCRCVHTEGVFWAQKRKQQSQRPLLNHLTSEKTKQNFRPRPDAPGWLHPSGTYHSLSRNLPPPPPAQKTYHPLPNYKCHLN